MKAIEKKMVAAFFSGYEFHESNTAVIKMLGSWYVTLFGNTIARRDEDGTVYYSCAGYSTATTRSRLQALGAPCRIHNYTMIDTNTGKRFPDTLTRF